MAAILALLFGLSLFGGAVAEAQQVFALYCRGQYHYIVFRDGSMQISLNKAQVAAGNLGVSLPEGTCAWADRPISASEPSALIFPQAGAGNTALVVCSQSTDCTFQVMAYNDSAGRFRVTDPMVWIWNR